MGGRPGDGQVADWNRPVESDGLGAGIDAKWHHRPRDSLARSNRSAEKTQPQSLQAQPWGQREQPLPKFQQRHHEVHGGCSTNNSNSAGTPPNMMRGLSIDNATYGSGRQASGVTQRVRDSLREGRLVMSADNAMVGRDPAPDVLKTLRITYTVDGGRPQFAEVSERTRVCTPTGAVAAPLSGPVSEGYPGRCPTDMDLWQAEH